VMIGWFMRERAARLVEIRLPRIKAICRAASLAIVLAPRRRRVWRGKAARQQR